MSLGQVRAYIKERAREVLPRWSEWSDGFNSANIPASVYGKTYHINYGALSSEALNDTSIRDNWPVSVELFFKGSRNPKEAIDEAMDMAHALRLSMIAPKSAMTGVNIKNVVCNGITPEPIHASNDNSVKVTLEFTFNLMF